MKGLALLGKGEIGWIEKDKPVPGPRDVICQPIAVCPCTTDAHCVKEFPFPHMKGIFLGHEAVGKIVEAGSEVHLFKPGDVVVVPSVTPEWDGWEVQDGLSKFANGSGYLFTQKKDGVFAEYFHVNDADQNLALLPEGISPEEGIMAVDMLATACAGVEAADIRFGDTVVVCGIGPVGLLCIAAAKLKGAGKIIALGTREISIEIAYQYGASEVLDYHDPDLMASVIEANGGRPADVVITAGGNASVIEQALSFLKFGGTVSNVAGFVGDAQVSFSTEAWFLGTADKTIKGVMVQGGGRYMERMLSLMVQKRIDVKPIACPVMHGFDKIPDALQLMVDQSRDIIKPVVIIDENL